jgi:hypothetical protein
VSQKCDSIAYIGQIKKMIIAKYLYKIFVVAVLLLPSSASYPELEHDAPSKLVFLEHMWARVDKNPSELRGDIRLLSLW